MQYFQDYIKTKRRAENFDDEDDNDDGNEDRKDADDYHNGIPLEEDEKKETPFHIKMVVEVIVKFGAFEVPLKTRIAQVSVPSVQFLIFSKHVKI